MAIPPHKLGWMAGVIDLKGRLIRKNNKQRAEGSKQIVLCVESTDISIIRALGSMTGTNPELKAAQAVPAFMRKGCVEHCPEKHQHVNEEVVMPRTARWTVTGAGMAVVLNNLDPYLVVDRGYDEAVVDVIGQTMNRITHSQGSGMIRASLLRLRECGWVLPAVYEKALKEESEKWQRSIGQA